MFTKNLSSPAFKRLSLALAAAAALAQTTGAFAASGTWTQTVSGGTWSPSVNTNPPWAGGIVAEGIDATADFSTLNIAATNTVHYDFSGTIGNLIFGDTTPSNNWILDNNGNPANTLTLATTVGTPTVTVNSGNANISLQLAGNQGLNKAGAATLILSGNNSYTGTTTVTTGTLQIGAAGTSGSVAGNIANNVAASVEGVVFNRSDAYTYSGTISGSGRVAVVGTGTTIFTSANTYSGFTIVRNGATLRGSDNTVYGGASQTVKSVFGTNGILPVQSGTTYFQLRANGLNDNSDQTLTFNYQFQASTGGQILNIDVDREGGSGTGKTIGLAATGLNFAVNASSTTTLNLTGGNGYSLSTSILTLGGGNTTGSALLNPTTSFLKIGNVTNSTSNTVAATKTLILGGTSIGNVVSGSIINGSVSSNVLTAVTKNNTSTWTLNGINAYTGATTVNAGTLLIGDSTHTTASLAAGSVVTVNNGGTLGGYGIINGNTTINGALSPGASAGKLTFNADLTLNASATTTMEIGGTGRGVVGGYDAVDLAATSNLIYGGTLTLDISGVIADGTYDLFLFTVAPTGSFSAIALAGSGGYTGPFVNNAGIWTASSGGKNFTFTQSTGDLLVAAIPEPGSAALLAFGAAVVLGLRKRKRASL